MKLWCVDDVMTRDVVSVGEDTPYRELVDLLISRRVSAVPVVDRHDRVTGVVSEADLLHKVEAAGGVSPRIFDAWRRRGDRAKAGGRTAAEVMTSPVVSADGSLSLAAAARRMQRERVKRLPVVDHQGHLIGIVTRSDLLKVHRRSDTEICRDVVAEALPGASVTDGTAVRVTCVDGVVSLAGRVHFRSAAARLAGTARRVPGVVDVADGLTFDIDDSMINGSERGTPFGVA
ncbi:CBS domain-containing protein [Actinoplanes sp. CA-051413]|uniref:CBS domain-containing protein n=1 Tax=Actinoplanes sp. CA-051413 TaxID=3239899 RepID=UPI003D984306